MTAHIPQTVAHNTVTIERIYPASPGRVFAAWATAEAKARWFAPDATEHTLDFRIGGLERNRGRSNPEGPLLTFESTYHDIVPDKRIVFTSSLIAGSVVATISLSTVEFHQADGPSTRLLLTQQNTFLDGHEHPDWREHGLREQLEALALALAACPPTERSSP